MISLLPMGCTDPQAPVETTAEKSTGASSPSSPPGQTFHVDMDQVPQQARQRIHSEEAKERLTPHSVSAPGNVALDLSQVAKV
ncbi:MAG TPA: hypothetical protein PKZ24_08860, partial [Nitrospirales bacterium]|nr:hypothetical protein [Nitrospirales bacterium]